MKETIEKYELERATAAVGVLKHQLRNIDHVLTVMVETWEQQAASLENVKELEALAEKSKWTEVTVRQAKAVATRACAAHLKNYIDTWAEP